MESKDVPWCDFGQEMNNLLNRIANYAKDHKLSPDDVETALMAGLSARLVLLERKAKE